MNIDNRRYNSRCLGCQGGGGRDISRGRGRVGAGWRRRLSGGDVQARGVAHLQPRLRPAGRQAIPADAAPGVP